jgi:hypothetical protein
MTQQALSGSHLPWARALETGNEPINIATNAIRRGFIWNLITFSPIGGGEARSQAA